MVKLKSTEAPTEKMPTAKTSDYMRWIKIGGQWRGEGDRYEDGLPRWVPESTIINPKACDLMTGDDLIDAIYKGGWKFGPLLQNGNYGLLIVYREKV